MLFAEWGNRAIHLWKVELDETQLVEGQAAYTVATDVNDVLEAFISTSKAASNTTESQDLSLTKIDRSTYAAIPNKFSKGSPSQYYVSRQTTPVIYVYQTPDLNNYTYIKYYVIKRIEDSGKYTNTADVAYRFLPCMTAGLAYYLAIKNAPDRVQMLKMLYEDELQRALAEDGSSSSTYISPKVYYPES